MIFFTSSDGREVSMDGFWSRQQILELTHVQHSARN